MTTVTTSKQVVTTSVSLPYGVTISYPQNWEKEELSELGLRDYGRTTINIANFFSLDITPERAIEASGNVDTSAYTTLSIDVDPNPVSDFDQYFNLVVLALQNYYGHIDITKHDSQLKISNYLSYELNFDVHNSRRCYIFTNVDGTVYTFTFKNPSSYSKEVQDMYKPVKIVPPAPTPKHR